MNKKILVSILTITMVLYIGAISVSAADLTPANTSGQTAITTNVAVDYMVSIPADTTIPYGALTTKIGEVKATKFVTEAGSTLTVTATPANNKLVSALGSEIPYTCSFTSQVISDTTTAYPVNINITQANWDTARAGSYSDIINFAITYAK